MDRTREPRTQDCFNFLNSFAFKKYSDDFQAPYFAACKEVGLDPYGQKKWPMEWEKIGRLCQVFWEKLPNHSMIRRGAFFELCNFAEDYCFGDHGI
jgi:hypothetical protein